MAQKTCYAAEKNKQVILEVLQPLVHDLRVNNADEVIRVLEIASGTGEHANLFADNIANLHYQPTEPQTEMHESIVAWTGTITKSKVNAPIALDVNEVNLDTVLPHEFSAQQVDVMICINMIHISPFHCTDSLFRIASHCLKPGGKLLTYGPYRVQGYMVESNVAFNESLKNRNPEWGVRDLEAIEEVAKKYNIELSSTVTMPANNLSLIFSKQA